MEFKLWLTGLMWLNHKNKTSNITKVTISRLKNNGGLVMDNGTLVQINTKTEQAKKQGI
jgi:hypothetical protein